MNLLAVIISVTVVISLVNAQLYCLECDEKTDETCDDTKTVLCGDTDLTCHVAHVLVDGKSRYTKGCIESIFCTNLAELCPSSRGSGPKIECLATGCCNMSSCKANLTALPKPTPTMTSTIEQQSSTPVPDEASTQAMASTSTPAPPAEGTSMPVSPSMVSSTTMTNSQHITDQILVDDTTPEPTCSSSIRYLTSPLAILLVVLGLVVF